MEQTKKEELQWDLWRFMIIGNFLYSMFYALLKSLSSTDRPPFRYFLLAGLIAIVTEALLYFSIRNWPGRWKTAVVWILGVLWITVCLVVGR